MAATRLRVLKVMDSIVKEAELNYSDWTICTDLPQMDSTDDAVAMTRAARELAQDRNVSSIAVFTHSGRTALLMSKAKPALLFWHLLLWNLLIIKCPYIGE